RRSTRGMWVGAAFLVSGTILLALAGYISHVGINFGHGPGVPVKDYITQSGVFTLCAFAFVHIGIDRGIERRWLLAIAALALASLFIANIVYVTTSRTTLVVLPVLLLLLGIQRASWRAVLGCVLAGLVAATTLWFTSPYVRMRVTSLADEVVE